MSPVFRHGRLRLYLLKLLDEAPKHGYEVIRLLQDRFMGVYAPSPGTIYPRLARLEEEGLVTHDEVDGRKVYKITEKGRAEIRDRMDDLAELEQEIAESVRDIAREVKEDVRETVRSLREEIARAARDVHREDRRQAEEDMQRARDEARRAQDEARGHPRDQEGQAREDAKDRAERARADARDRAERAREEARRAREEARREPHAGAHPPHEEHERAGEEAGARFRAGRGWSRRDWGDWTGLRDWPGWRDWPGIKDVPGWRDWPGGHDWPGWRDRPGGHDWPGQGRMPGWPDPAKFRDLERLALQFAAELRRLAAHASAIGEDTFGDLRTILDEALTKIRTEIFEPERPQDNGGAAPKDAPDAPPQGTADSPPPDDSVKG
jgi:DNA-binding PadR family transcriptional regulator